MIQFDRTMSDKLVEKIQKLLDSSVNTESAAVHFLSLVRGVAERDGAPEGTSFALKMYCHWAMHISLTYAHTTKGFLKQVDDFVLRNVSPGNSPKWPADYKYEGPMSFSDEHYLFREFIYLDNLRRDLKLFLGKYFLPTALCDDNTRWFAFITAYAAAIEDRELTIRDKSDTLIAVSKVVFRKGRKPLMKDPQMPFSIQWDVHFEDGRILKFTGEAGSGRVVLSHGMQLVGTSKYLSPPRHIDE